MTHTTYLTYLDDNMGHTQKSLKRLCDVIFSFFALIILSPIFLIIFIVLKLKPGSPVIFSQERIGFDAKPFTLYKFRTLKTDTEEKGPQLIASTNETMSTTFQCFLRNHHLDELPQLWNVLKGDMSIVGPRPELKYYIDQIQEKTLDYYLIYQMKPGLTSEATLYNGYTDTIEKMITRLNMDIHYLRNRTLNLDMQIMINTFLAIISGKKF